MRRRPKLLDLFCGAGGCSMGYYQAGFDVVGVDLYPQPHYPFKFIRANALDFPVKGFDAVHASPPCQAHTSMRFMYNAKEHLDLIPAMRDRLTAWGGPWVIENVPGAPLIDPLVLCGTMFGLRTADGRAELRRHRQFESNRAFTLPKPCAHGSSERVIGVYGGHGRDRCRKRNTQDFPTRQRHEAMGIDWMSGNELSQAIPPAYTRYIGAELLKVL